MRHNACMIRVAVAVSIALALATSARAQTTDKNPLAQVKALKCRFTIYASGSWAKTTQEPAAQVRQPETLTLEIDEIDTDSGSGRVTGTAGPPHPPPPLPTTTPHFLKPPGPRRPN